MPCARRAASVRAVLDTNVVVSGLLWRTAPRQVLDAARDGRLTLFTSSVCWMSWRMCCLGRIWHRALLLRVPALNF